MAKQNEKWKATALMKINDSVGRIVVLPNNDIYFSTHSSLFKYVKDKEPQLLLTIPYHHLSSFAWDGNNCFYICEAHVVEYFLETRITGHTWRIWNPWGLSIDRENGFMYVGEGKSTISKINLKTKTTQDIRLNYDFDRPRSLQYLKGLIYVVDGGSKSVRVIKDQYVQAVTGHAPRKGYADSKDGTFNKATLGYPDQIALDIDGSLLVPDRNAIRKLDFTKKELSTVYHYEEEISSCEVDNRGNIYVAAGTKIIFLKLNTWKWQRFVWIGKMKEDKSYCMLAQLPKELIKEIAYQVDVIPVPPAPAPDKKRKRKG